MIFDTHAHYDDEAFDGDRDELLAGLPAAGIGRVVNIAASPRSIDECLDLAHRFPHVYCALGIHPEHCAEKNCWRRSGESSRMIRLWQWERSDLIIIGRSPTEKFRSIGLQGSCSWRGRWICRSSSTPGKQRLTR